MNKINFKSFNRLVFLLTVLTVLAIMQFLNLLDNFMSVIGALAPFYLAFVIIWIMKPFSEFLQDKFNVNPKKANLVSILLNLLIVLIVIFVILPILIIQVWEITSNSTQLINSITNNLNKLLAYMDLHQIDIFTQITGQLQSILDTKSIPDIIGSIDFSFIPNALSSILGAVGSLTKFVLTIVFAYIMAIYLANDFDAFVEKGLNFMFANTSDKNKHVFMQTTSALSGYFKGLVLDCSFIMVIMTLGSAIIGIPSPLLFGVLAGVFNVIPYLGPVLGGVPLVFVALSQGIPTAIFALILVCITQLVESQLLQPKIMAKSTNLHPVTVICGLIIFGSLFGLVGMLIATPTLAVISVIIKNSDLDIRI